MKSKRLIPVLLALCLLLTACGGGGGKASGTDIASTKYYDGGQLGQGKTDFSLEVTYLDGTADEFSVSTDAETVGEALLSIGFIEGEAGEPGLYVTTVNGVTLDYDEDGAYWAFYINGEYAVTGVDSTPVTAGAQYALTATKG